MHWRRPLLRSFADAGAGIVSALRTQRNARIHLAATLIVSTLSIGFQITAIEWTAVLLSMGLVWTSELINTAIESIVDLVSPDKHLLARTAKDTASGGVLMAAMISVAVGLIIFGPRLWEILN